MNTTAELIEDIRSGKMVILIDDESRENEGDIVIAADYITPDLINFMATEARGLICLAMTHEQIEKLNLPLMVKNEYNNSPNRTAFTVSIEASSGVTTGISAADRAHTVKVAANPNATAREIVTPGHIFPIKGQEGGVLKRAGHTEGSIDLAKLAGINPAAVICEVLNPDGTMARLPELKKFAEKHNIKIGSIEDLIEYRIQNEMFVEEVAESKLDTQYGEGFRVKIFENRLDGKKHVALVKGDVFEDQPTLVRVHSECILGDVFGDKFTQSDEYLKASIRRVNENGQGIIVYLKNEDMFDRLSARVSAYKHLDDGDTPPEDLRKLFKTDKRDYGVGAQILRALGVRKLKLLTNHPIKRVGIKGYGLEVVDSETLSVSEQSNHLHKNSEQKKEETRWLN